MPSSFGHIVAFVAFALLDFLHDDGAFLTGVVGQRTEGLLDHAAHDLESDFFVTFEGDRIERLLDGRARFHPTNWRL